MAKVKIQGNASGTGVLTVTAPNTSTDRTITLPDADVTLGAATPSIDDNGDATAITINSSEQVGIGQTSPSAQLHLKQTSGDQFLKMEGATTNWGWRNQSDGTYGLFDFTNSRWVTLGNSSSAWQFYVNGSEKARFTTDGLTFNGDTASANALDDYEEGTYTYTITGSSGGSMTPRSGYNHFAYTKVGRLVTVQGRFETSGSHTASGTLYVSLPFSSHNGVSHSAQGAGVVSIYRAGANFNNVRAVVRNNSSQFEFYYNEGGTGDSDATVQGSDVDATMEGSLSITYMT